MFTSDPLYKKPLIPGIEILNTSANTILYSYSGLTGIATGITTVFPLFCSVTLSQSSHGEFVIQFEDQSKVMEPIVKVGSRVRISAGKPGGLSTRVMSGIIRRKGYSRGGNNKILYNISGSSTGIRLNERITYNVSEASKSSSGAINVNDTSRIADTLLANALQGLISDGILSISNLAANSDVQTFIPSLSVEYGELQDVVNYIEEQSGGEVVVDTNDLVNFRYEIKTNLFGRGFTIKNSDANKANDDADDTMYLVGKNWNYEDSFYKSDVYANRVYGILPPGEPPDTSFANLSVTSATPVPSERNQDYEIAAKFRPPHSHYEHGDIYVAVNQHNIIADILPVNSSNITNTWPDQNAAVLASIRQSHNALESSIIKQGIPMRFRIAGPDVSDTPNNLAVVTEFDILPHNLDFHGSSNSKVGICNQVGDASANYYDLDTTRDYWLILSSVWSTAGIDGDYTSWWGRAATSGVTSAYANAFTSSSSNANSGWNVVTGTAFWYAMPTLRAYSHVMWDPKAIQAVSSGITQGLYTDATVPDVSSQIKTKEAMYRHMAQQLYSMSKPRTVYNFPSVMCPNIPPFPGDPIIISDTVLGFSTSGKQVAITTCGDMTYSWGAMDTGSYDAPTILSINAIGVHSRYR